MPRDRLIQWGLLSQVEPDGSVSDYSGRAVPVDRLPAAAEISGDGKFAEVRRRDVVVAVYVNLGTTTLDTRRRST